MAIKKKFKTIFFGTPDFAVPVLESIIKLPLLDIKAVVTQPDKPVGRKKELKSSPVKKVALNNSIFLLQPDNLKDQDFLTELKKIKPDLAIVAAYGKILPREILDIFPKGSINVHGSLLPKLRGASPIQTAILESLEEIGVTIMLMNKKMDEGPILAQESIKIGKKETFGTLHDKLATLGAELLIKTIPQYLEGKIKPQEQNHKEATYTKIIKKEDGKIDWNKSADYIEGQIRAFNPWPGTFLNWKGKRLKILEAEVIDIDSKPGKPFLTEKKELAIGCSEVSLLINKLQLEGKKAMNSQEFLRGYPDFV